ncbi:MAG: hypothetical protein C5B51_32610 [Terriglobia bacterium]|nr:MAG: hypothetical protein C5B51_32610 [Terriglobia bacterium]
MLRTGLLALLFAGALAVGVNAADVFVRVGPPPPVRETVIVRPGPNYVWIPGYHRWDGGAYAWVPGRWELPPRPRARWVAHRWVRRRGGWVFVEGRWR